MVSAEFLRGLAAISWPLIVGLVALYFAKPVKRLVEESYEATVGGPGFEATFKRDVRSAFLFGLSVGEEPRSPDQISEEQLDDLLTELSTYLNPETRDELTDASLLWVDDSPENNLTERETFASLGIDIDLSKSTTDAIEKIEENDYDVIISDMGRPEGDRAGYDLLQKKQDLNDTTPFIIYSFPVKDEHRQEARERGAFGSTGSSRELYQMVRRALGGSFEVPTPEGSRGSLDP